MRAAHMSQGDLASTMQPIEIRTFREILERKLELACFCPGSRLWATCDLAMLVRNGRGDRDLGS